MKLIKLAKEGSWILIGQMATIAGSLVLIRILTEYLTPREFGQLTLGLTAGALINQVVIGGIVGGIARFYPIANEKKELQSFFSDSTSLIIIAANVIVAIGVFALINLWIFGLEQWIPLASSVILYSMISGVNNIISGVHNAARNRAIVAINNSIDAWLRIGLAVSFMLWLGISSTTVIIGYIFSSLIVVISQLFFLKKSFKNIKIRISNATQWRQEIWNYSLPMSTWGAFTWMQQASDRWALQMFTTTDEVGQYAVLYQLGYTPIAIAIGLMMSFIAPIIYQRTGDTKNNKTNYEVYRLVWRISNFSLLITMLAFVFTNYFHEWLFSWLVSSEYQSKSYLISWILLAGGLFAAAQTLSLKLMSELKSVSMMIPKISTAIIGVFLNFIGAKIWGIDGVVGAMISFSLIYYLWMIRIVTTK